MQRYDFIHKKQKKLAKKLLVLMYLKKKINHFFNLSYCLFMARPIVSAASL